MTTMSEKDVWLVVDAPRTNPRVKGSADRPDRKARLFFLFLTLVATAFPPVRGQDGELCVVQTPLNTHYFVPYAETPNHCNGCLFQPPQKGLSDPPHSFSAVHLLEIDNSIIGVVQLTLDFRYEDNHTQGVPQENVDRGPAVVIASSRTSSIALLVLFNNLPDRHTSIAFIKRPQDTITFQNAFSDYPVTVREDFRNKTSSDILRKLETEFGHVTSLTVAQNVNKIKLYMNSELPVGLIGDFGEECSPKVQQESTISECSLVVRKQASGCFHETMLGHSESDIHIIEVDSEETQISNHSIALHITGLKPSDLSPNQKSQGETGPIRRNLTIILLSSHSTFWTVHISGIEGVVTLMVADGDQVENKSFSGQKLSLSVQRHDFPKLFDQMFVNVVTRIGTPVSYTRTEWPSFIDLFVPPKQEHRNKEEHSKPSTEQLIMPKNANKLIDSFLSILCLPNEVSIALPIWIAKRMRGVTMNLQDKACQADNNGTHIVLRSKFSECGFFREEQMETYLYTNFVHIEVGEEFLGITDDEDFDGSGFGPTHDVTGDTIPTIVVQCRTDSIVNSKKFPAKIKYNLTVFGDEGLKKSYGPNQFPVRLTADSTVYTKIEFSEDGSIKTPELNLLVERCILSASEYYISTPVVLIRKSCAFQPYVTIQKSLLKKSFMFNFQLSMDYLPSEKVFLHCQVGVCSSASLPKPFINKCVDPDSYCSKDYLMKAFKNQAVASAVDAVLIGPFIIQETNEGDSTHFPPRSQKPVPKDSILGSHHFYQGSDVKAPIIVMEGLSTEIVVGIAIASFIIGVCLTATLWIIYLKTDPKRQKRPEPVMARNSGYDLSAHSGSSTPSSQAPMTA